MTVTWSGWEDLGGNCYSGVGVSSWAPDRLDCFVRGGDNRLWHRWWHGSGWSGWEHLGGAIFNDPGAVSWGPDRIDVFAPSGNRRMYHKWWA